MAGLQLLYMEHTLKTQNSLPKYWFDDVQMCMSAMKNRLPEKSYIVGSDLIDAFDYEQARVIQQRLVRRFGQLLQSWSDLLKVAREIRE